VTDNLTDISSTWVQVIGIVETIGRHTTLCRPIGSVLVSLACSSLSSCPLSLSVSLYTILCVHIYLSACIYVYVLYILYIYTFRPPGKHVWTRRQRLLQRHRVFHAAARAAHLHRRRVFLWLVFLQVLRRRRGCSDFIVPIVISQPVVIVFIYIALYICSERTKGLSSFYNTYSYCIVCVWYAAGVHEVRRCTRLPALIIIQ